MSRAPTQIWWSPSELGDARLPDLPATKRGVTKVAEREGWGADPQRARRRKGKGGGWEFHWTLLPSRAQQALLAKAEREEPAEPAAPLSRDEAWGAFDALPEGPRARAAERLGVIQAIEALERGGATRSRAVEAVATERGLSARTIWNWFDAIAGVREDDRLPYLAPRHRAAKRSMRRTAVHPDFAKLIRSDYLRPSQPSLTSVYDRACRIAEAEGIPTVPLHTIRRWAEREITPEALVLGRKGYDALKRLYPAQTRDKTALHAMEGVNGDFHRFDVFVRFPAGPGGQREEIARPQMVAFQDLYSGRLLAWRLDRTANSHAVQLCIGDMIKRWGIPEHVLLDNGREFAAKVITGGAPTRFRFKVREDDMSGLLTSLGCKIHWATPYAGQSKPIERAFRDLCDRVAKHPAFEGAYTGNRPDAKPENYGSRAVSLAEFTAVLTDEIERHNQRPDRRSEVAMGRSFAEVFDESYATAPIRKATEEQRRLWLMGAEGIRANSRNGELHFMGNRYWSDWMIAIRGQRVTARFDRAALWDGLHLYDAAGAYLGHAECQVKAGFFDMDDARSHARNRREWMKATKAEAAAYERMTAAEVADALPTPLPVGEPVKAKVIRPLFNTTRANKPALERPDEAAAHQAVIADLTTRQPKADAGTEEPRELYRRALDLERRLAAGEAVTKEQQLWLASFQKTPVYRAWADMVRDFGDGALG
ncbi:transposase domain-containing protein [Pseudoroseicyclus sp. H15]